MAKGEQCLELQDYMIQKTMMILSWAWLFSAMTNDLENCVFLCLKQFWERSILPLPAPPETLLVCHPGLKAEAQELWISTRSSTDAGDELEFTCLQLTSVNPPQTNPDKHKYSLLSLLSESFIKGSIEPLLENKLKVTLPAWKQDTGQNSAAKRTTSWQTLKGAVTDVPLQWHLHLTRICSVGLVPVSGLAVPGF